VILVIFSYPLQCHPCRASLNHILYWFHERSAKVDLEAGAAGSETEHLTNTSAGTEDTLTPLSVPLPRTKFIILTVLVLIASYITALSVQSLELMLAFVGATGSTSISFILPGFFGYSLLSRDYKTASKSQRYLRNSALALIIWGCSVSVVCLTVNIFVYAF
jgi:amino acid permease